MTKFVLQLLAMVFMLCDHMCATIMSQHIWLHWIGRLAFPIFAFMLAEGYFKTSNFKKYAKRMFFFAILAEIPINLITAGGFFYPFHQNVMWTFLISLFVMKAMDKILDMKGKSDANAVTVFMGTVGKLLLCFTVGMIGFGICFVTFVDYYGYGLLMVLVFFFSRKFRTWYLKATAKANMEELALNSRRQEWPQPYVSHRGMVSGSPAGMGMMIPSLLSRAFELVAMYYINVNMVRGEIRYFDIFGDEIGITIQGLALFALPLIWLYNGKQGYHSKGWQYFCYAFYPAHMLILGLLWMFL